MSAVDRPGRFKAKPIEWRVKEVNDKPMFEVDYLITEFLNPESEWEDWSPYDVQIQTGYYLFCKDGSTNEFAVKSVKECFGWSGSSLAELQSGDWSGIVVQLTIDWDEYKGKQSLKVKFTNHGDRAVATAATPEKLRYLDASWGAKLKALAGPVAAARPQPARPARETTHAQPANVVQPNDNIPF